MLRFLSYALFLVPPLASGAQQRNEERPIDSQQPLQVDLLASLDVSKLKSGAQIFAKSRAEWHAASCHMRTGAAISGHVVAVEPRSQQNKGSSVTVLFDTVGCDGHSSHILFNLFAVIVYPESHQSYSLSDYGTFGAASAAPHIGSGGGGGAHAAVPLDPSQDTAVKDAADQSPNLPKVIKAGQVFGQKNLLLAVGTGSDGGSILSSPKGNFRLEAGTQFVLMPRPISSPDVAPAVASAMSSTASPETAKSAEPKEPAALPAPAPKLEVDETAICSSSCNIVSATEEAVSVTAAAASTFSVARLGYSPHEKAEYSTLNYEAALTFLDADSLLFTFDLNRLRHRYSDGFRTESMRMVRAVLVNPSSHQIKSMAEWEVQGNGQYVWPLSQGRVLVHIRHALYLMNSDLKPVRTVSIPGQLAFVSLSPDGSHIAVGTLHERHSRDLHELIATAIHSEPEEDIDIQLFDENFKLLLNSYQSTSLPPPILSDDGQIGIHPTGHDRWRITEYSWNGTDRVIATIQSACRPDISTPLHQALFVVGCSMSPLQNWYRMLRTDSHPILLNRGSSREIEQAASSSNEKQFAVRVVDTERTKANGSFFHKSDLLNQKISIYRATDGKRIFDVTAAPSLAEQSFSLSPSGNKLAVLANGSISFYATP
jgi:hypothetical protein